LSPRARPLPHERDPAALHFDWGIVGVWAGLAGLIGARLVTCGTRFVRGRWAVTGAPRMA
jgi:Na+-driven multidrug efflux pump